MLTLNFIKNMLKLFYIFIYFLILFASFEDSKLHFDENLKIIGIFTRLAFRDDKKLWAVLFLKGDKKLWVVLCVGGDKQLWAILHLEVMIPARGPQTCLLYTSPSPRDATLSRMPSSA